jgi:hypothetical protein
MEAGAAALFIFHPSSLTFIDLRFRRDGKTTRYEVLGGEGELEVE